MKYGILFGGRSYEHDISVITAAEVAATLQGEAVPIYAKDGSFYLVKSEMDVRAFASKEVKLREAHFERRGGKGCLVSGGRKIFLDCMILCCHGGEGEDGRFSALMEVFDIPYTASDPLASAITMDKAAAKIFFDRFGFPNAKGVFLHVGDHLEKVSSLHYPLIVKPAHLGSSIGIAVAKGESALKEAIETACEFDDDVLAEEVIEGAKELNCAAFREGENIVVSAVESPVSWHDFLTFDDKYRGGKYKYGSDAAVEPSLEKRVQETTEEVYRALGLFGIARVDYLYDEAKDVLYLNEVNSQPGSLAYYLFEKVGIPFSELLGRVARASLVRAKKKGIISFNSGVLDNLCALRAK